MSAPTTSAQIVVMGVTGCGKTTAGTELAKRLGRRFVDGDSLHPPSNVAKMADGVPLTDADRWPWLAAVREVLRGDEPVVVACSSLRRAYRDLLRHAPLTVFVYLDLDQAAATARTASRSDHFMRAEMVASQFATLQRPASDELDVAVVDAAADEEAVLAASLAAVATIRPGTAIQPLVADGGRERDLSRDELRSHLAGLVDGPIAGAGRVLLVPPDHTRSHSQAGRITVELAAMLRERGRHVGVLPALGTHVPMGAAETRAMFGDDIAADELIVHDWRDGLEHVGEVSSEEVSVVTGGRVGEALDVAVDRELLAGWDLVVSIGQVVPHEVIGMANFTKNLVIGLGGAPTIHHSHFVGATAGLESIMGRAASPVRDLVDAAFDRFVAPTVDVLWLLTVVEDLGDGVAVRGFFAGEGGSMGSGGAAFRAAAELSALVNLDVLAEPLDRVACWLDPDEFHSTWLGNKAIYRTRMAMADGGELIVLAPGVVRFGEDDRVDELIRRHGYSGTAATLDAVARDPDLAANLSAAAHLVHGSSEGRFRIVYCTDPEAGGLTRDEVESVGFAWRPLGPELVRLGVGPTTPTGSMTAADGGALHFVANPALGLWTTRDRFDPVPGSTAS